MPGAVIYTIDAEDCISDVNREWTRFARENGGAPDPGAVLGKSLWDFVADEGNRTIYRNLVDAVRHNATPLSIPFRCDSPTLERHMTMTIAPGSLGEVAFVCALQYTFARSPQADEGHRPEPATIVECEGCHRLWTKSGWKDCWEMIKSGDLEIDDRPITLLHTRCTKC